MARKNPIQIRHLYAGNKGLIGTDVRTVCKRIVCKQMTRKNPPTGKTVEVCPECVDNTHPNAAFEIVRNR